MLPHRHGRHARDRGLRRLRPGITTTQPGRSRSGKVGGAFGPVSQDTAEHAVAELGWARLRFRAPVHHGDTIEAFTEVVAADPGPRRRDAGIVRFRHWGRRQGGIVAFEGERLALIRRRPAQAGT